MAATSWVAVRELKRQLTEINDASTVTIFDGTDNAVIAQASSWRGEIIHVSDLDTLRSRIESQKSTLQKPNIDKAGKKTAEEAIRRLEAKPEAW